MSTTIGRDHVINLVTGNPHPFAVHFDPVVVAHHAALGRATIHQVAARAVAVISFERRVEALMPFIVACPVISFLRRCAYTKKHEERTANQRDKVPPLHSITSSARASSVAGTSMPSALAVVRLITSSNLVGCSTGRSPGFAPRRILSTYSAARRNMSVMSGP